MLYFVTSNQNKIKNAKDSLVNYRIEFLTKNIELFEIQASTVEEVSINKAKQAFEKLGKSLFVEDTGWSFTSLNGFPGPYMASICQWFTAQDFLNLINPYQNREVLLNQVVTYIDSNQIKTFSASNKGQVLAEPKGKGYSADQVVTLRNDQKSMAECKSEGIPIAETMPVWDLFAEWLTKHQQ